MPEPEQQPRRLTPFIKLDDPSEAFKDLTPHVKPADEVDEEVEEALTPPPKDSSAQESVTSSESPTSTVQQPSGTHALPADVLPTDRLEAAVRESGKLSDESEDEPQPPSPTTPAPDPSSPSSSETTSPGKNTPPVVTKPPTGG